MKVKILHSGPVSPRIGGTEVGGISNHIAELTIHLAKRGYNSYIIDRNLTKTFKYNDQITIERGKYRLFLIIWFIVLSSFQVGLKIFRIDSLSLREKAYLLFRYQLYKKIIRKNNIDVVHIHSVYNIDGFLALFFKSISFIVTEHGFLHGSIQNDKEKYIKFIYENVSAMDKVIAISDHSYKSLLDNNICKEDKIIKISNPLDVDTTLLNSFNREKFLKELSLPIVGNILFFNGYSDSIERKGIDLLSAAVKYLSNNENLELFLIVNTNTEGEALFRKENDCKNVRFYNGNLSFEDLRKIYMISDIFVVPSRSEGFGLVYIESLSFGCPIIGFPATFKQFEREIGEFIGYSYDANKDSIEYLAKLIINLLEYSVKINRSLLSQKTIEIYSWDRNIYKFIKLYEDTNQETN